MRFVDLSLELDESPSERLPVVVERIGHAAGARQMSELFGIPVDELPAGLGWAGEQVCLATHSGTHMDAPWHYGPVSGAQRAAFISEVPLDWCFGPGLVLDLSALEDGSEISAADLERACAETGHLPAPGDIVLLRTGADSAWGSPEYPECGAGLGREGLAWLLDRGAKVIGTDAWGLDRPFGPMRRAYAATGDPAVVWPTHFAGRERPYCQLEKLTGLDRLPPRGFTVACFPVKVALAGAGWVRVVAMVDDAAGGPGGEA